jgi:hypothetical protein
MCNKEDGEDDAEVEEETEEIDSEDVSEDGKMVFDLFALFHALTTE